MNLFDSSAWIEYFIGSNLSSEYSDILENFDDLLVPSIVIYEVYKYIHRQKFEKDANKIFNFMINGNVVLLSPELSKKSASISIKYKLPMADSIIYATAINYNSIVYTFDDDFIDLPNVIYYKKK